jgi:hypothetical protein
MQKCNNKQYSHHMEREIKELLVVVIQIDSLHTYSLSLSDPYILSFVVLRRNVFSLCYSP